MCTYVNSLFRYTSQITSFSRECFLHHYGGQLKAVVEQEVGEKIDCRRRIQAVLDIVNRFWTQENRRPNFDRSTKDIILILLNSRQVDTNLIHLPPALTKYCKLTIQSLGQYFLLSLFYFLHFNISLMIDVFLFSYSFLHFSLTPKKVLQPLSW